MAKKRSEAFFGMHFDFHAGPNQKNIGEFCDYDTIEELITTVKPDYVQCDTKGHAGITSYPTKIGNPAPEMKGDILRMWREVTKKHDVALFAHHSGVWDNRALELHPDWSVVDENGNRDAQHTSCFGPYVDELLIPQLLEMALEYGLDGAWVDGDCWAAQTDYSKWATEKYKSEHYAEPPRSDSPDYYSYMKFCRHGFRDYVNKYVRAIHAAAPDFEITSNWMYSSFMPEPPVVPIDFISGDYNPNNSITAARFEGRVIASQGKCWDLMSWGFSNADGYFCLKEYEQLCQEAAAVIMLGGGFQFYNRQLVGSVEKSAIPMWGELAEFCRQREELCHKAAPVPQVAMILSRKAHYHNINSLYSNGYRYLDEMRNALPAILNAGYSVEVLPTHRALGCDLNAYGCIIVTDLQIIEPDLRSALLDYANHGGNLVITGYNAAQVFLPYLDVDIIGGDENAVPIYLEDSNGVRGPLHTPYRDVTLSKDARPLAYFDFVSDNNQASHIAASTTSYGDGTISGIYYNIGAHNRHHSAAADRTLCDILGKLFTSSVRFDRRENIELAIMRKDGELRVNLLNCNGEHDNASYRSFEHVPSIHNLAVEIDYPESPKSVMLEPEGKALDYEYSDGVIRTIVPEIHIHSVICVK